MRQLTVAQIAAAGDLQVHVAALQQQIKTLKDQKKAIIVSQVDDFQKRMDTLSKIDELQQENHSLREENVILKSNLCNQEKMILELESELKSQMKQRDTEQKKLLKLQDVVLQMAPETNQLKVQNKSLFKENQNLKLEIEEKDRLIASLQEQVNSLKTTVDQNLISIKNLEQKVEQLSNALDNIKISDGDKKF